MNMIIIIKKCFSIIYAIMVLILLFLIKKIFVLDYLFLGCREEREGLIPGGRRGSGSSEDLQTQHRDKARKI